MRVKSVKFVEIKDKYFFDLNVSPHNNYVLWNGCVVHNTGILLSHIRPEGSIVDSTQGVASGPCSFLRVFDVAMDVVKQGGKRRGASMGILHCSHPDIVKFITSKDDVTLFQNFNLSVGTTDDFIQAAIEDKLFNLRNPKTKEITPIKAKKLFDILCTQAWKNGEPGVLFLDTINRFNTTPFLGKIEGTNPCSEVVLYPYEACNLGSINVSKMIKGKDVDWDRLTEVVSIAVRFLDDVIDANVYPNVKIDRKTKTTRKIGLGIMGWADLLIFMGIRYDSEEAMKLARRMMRNIKSVSHDISEEIGKEKGYCLKQIKRRNATLTSIAPTGTLSILADCSSGIEPIFGKEYTKTVMGNVKLNLGNKYKSVDEKLLVSAHEITVEKHIEMQSIFQKYVDNSISKTINMSNSATVEDVKKAFLLAHSLGCKSLSVYRDGSRDAPLKKVEQGLSECESGKCML